MRRCRPGAGSLHGDRIAPSPKGRLVRPFSFSDPPVCRCSARRIERPHVSGASVTVLTELGDVVTSARTLRRRHFVIERRGGLGFPRGFSLRWQDLRLSFRCRDRRALATAPQSHLARKLREASVSVREMSSECNVMEINRRIINLSRPKRAALVRDRCVFYFRGRAVGGGR